MLGVSVSIATWIVPANGWSQVRRLGDEFQVNGYTPGGQLQPAVATIGEDEFIVLWHGGNPILSQLFGVRAQRFHRSGTRLGSEYLLSAQATSDANIEMLPAIASREDGSFVVVWTSYYDRSSSDVVAARFDSTGTLVGELIQANTSGDRQASGSVATDDAGHFVVVWNDGGNRTEYRAVTRFRSFSPDGSPLTPDIPIATNPAGGVELSARVAMRPATGESLVVWSQLGGDGDGFGIRGRRIDTAGARVGSEFQVNTYTTSYQARPDVAAQGEEFVVVWHSYDEDRQGFGIFGQRLAADGAALGSAFQVNQYTPYHQALPSVAVDAEGNFVVVWESCDTLPGGPLGQDGDGRGIFARAFDRDAKPLGSEFQVNTYTRGDQGYTRIPETDVAMFGGGDFVVVWNSPDQDGWDTGIFGQRFHLDPALGPVCGDVTGADLRVTVTDALALLHGAIRLSECLGCVCDANSSGTVAASDALLVLNRAVGLPLTLTCPPCEPGLKNDRM